MRQCAVVMVLAWVAALSGWSPPQGRSQQAVPRTRIVLVGDSTVTDESGWGLGFRRLVSGQAEVVNEAASGRSSKSYLAEGRWTRALALKGHYYLIQFGHNDQPGKGPERETDPETTFRQNIRRYVDEARRIGAHPVLVTSLTRRHYTYKGTITTTLTPYVDAVKAVAAEKRVPVIDLHAISITHAEQAGDAEWARLSPLDDKQQIDRTHLNEAGSVVVGGMVAAALRTGGSGPGALPAMVPAAGRTAVRTVRAVVSGAGGELERSAAGRQRPPRGHGVRRRARRTDSAERRLGVGGAEDESHQPRGGEGDSGDPAPAGARTRDRGREAG